VNGTKGLGVGNKYSIEGISVSRVRVRSLKETCKPVKLKIFGCSSHGLERTVGSGSDPIAGLLLVNGLHPSPYRLPTAGEAVVG
jgi:hypothetical protein